jgi:preprotein translocase subunit SecA
MKETEEALAILARGAEGSAERAADLVEACKTIKTVRLPEMPKSHLRGTYKPIRTAPKVGRNDVCFCGSGLKFKKCCGKV